MTSRPYHRQKKFDRLLSPGATVAEIECDFVLAPFDRACREMDRLWGIDRLPGLVPLEMAQRYGRAIAAMNASIEAQDPEATRDNAGNCVKGLAAMNAAAEAASAPKADPTIWEYDCDGYKFGVMADDRSWQAAQAARPDLQLRTMREVGNALRAYDQVVTGEVMAEVKKHFPAATVKAIRPRTDLEKELDDEIPF